jgi:hypothetical protein
MPRPDISQSDDVQPVSGEERAKAVAQAIEHAKAKNARLRLMKARNENYLAEQRDEREPEEDRTEEL